MDVELTGENTYAFGFEKLELVGDIDFKTYPRTDDHLLGLRETIVKAFL